MVECFLRDLTQNRLQCGVFGDLEEPILVIGSCIERHIQSPKRFM